MRHDELDRILSEENDLTPSSGFLESVMETVRSDASAPPPIPFPWKRAWPGVAAFAAIRGNRSASRSRPADRGPGLESVMLLVPRRP